MTATHLELLGDARDHRSSRTTIEAIEREGPYLWVRRRRAHDWLIRFEDADGAARIEAALNAALA